MELFSVSLQAFRRFSDKTTLRTNGKLLALVGPNEAGKSSILAALESLNDEQPLAAEDVARGKTQGDVEIVASFLLDADELTAARLPTPTWLQVHKSFDGDLAYSFRPKAPERDVSHREALIAATADMLANQKVREALDAIDPDIGETLDRVGCRLHDAGPNANSKLLGEVAAAAALFDSMGDIGSHKLVKTAARRWAAAETLEQAPNPQRHAINTLHLRTPKFLLFDEEARRLESNYVVANVASEMPAPLEALLLAARLDIRDVVAAANAGDNPELTTLEKKANKALEANFKEAWRQSGISVALRLSPTHVEVQVVNEDERHTRLAERSDGLRQFVALHAFASQAHADRPVLLIDEAEQRLHYDAQADLVQMLIRQEVAAKVIYTTHSAGCLPEDLGHGVRLVQPHPTEKAWSRIVNKFWANPSGGLSPLLFGLGATTLAFFPTRRAVCVEGPGDMLLYPTMFREALGAPALGFQFVPGLSSAAKALTPIIPAQAANVAFLVDGDAGGRKIAADLDAGGVPKTRIVVLEGAGRNAIEIEDFVDPALLLEAANALIARHCTGIGPIARTDLPSKRRMEGLEAAFQAATGRPVDKVELAYEILDKLDADPRRRILDPRRRDDLAGIVARVAAALGVADASDPAAATPR